MKTYNNSVTLRNDGVDPSTSEKDLNAGIGINVTVRAASTPVAGQGALASIFNITEDAIANPLQTDNQGNYTFKVADGLYDIVIAEGTADQTTLSSVEIVELITPDFINNLSLTYVFDTFQDMVDSTITFPDGKVIKTTVHNTTSNAGGATYIKTSGSSSESVGSPNLTGGGYVKLQLTSPLDFRVFGAIPDDSFDNAGLFTAAKNCHNSTLLFSGGGFYFSGNANLDGIGIIADKNAWVTSEGGFFTSIETRLFSSIRLVSQGQSTDLIIPANVNVPYELYNSGSGTSYLSDESFDQIDLTSDVELTNISSYNTRSTFGGVTVNTDIIAWPSPTGNESGFFIDVESGDFIECNGIDEGTTATGSFITSVITDKYRYFMTITLGNLNLELARISSTGTGEVLDSTTTDGNLNFAIPSDGGNTTPSVRITGDQSFEFYINETLFYKVEDAGYIQQAGFTISAQATATSNAFQLRRPLKYNKGKIPKGSKSLKIMCIGDSLTIGAGASISYPELLQSVAQNAHGLGDLEVVNNGSGGQKWSYFASGGGSSISYTGYDYVFVMLGTNDVQGKTPINSMGGAVNTLLSRIISDGATPIVGMFPMWTDSATSGGGDVNAKNSHLAPIYRSEIKYRCKVLGVEVANPLGYFANNMAWLPDNIHPTTEGHVAIASAFTAALSKSVAPKTEINRPVKKLLTPLNGWGNSTAGGGVLEKLSCIKEKSGVVTIVGNVAGGATADIIALLPPAYRPSKEVTAACVANFAHGAISITASGELYLAGGSDAGVVQFSISYLSA